MSCLFSDDIAVGAEARDALAIGVTGYSHPSRAPRVQGEKKKTRPVIISFFSHPHATSPRRFRTKIAASLVLICINTALSYTRGDKKSRAKKK